MLLPNKKLSLEEQLFEHLLAQYCAPVLQKIKVANMFHVDKHIFTNLLSVIQTYNKKLNVKNIYLKLLSQNSTHITIYIYCKSMLEHILCLTEIQEFLTIYHYPCNDVNQSLHYLEKRLFTCCGYPHEIGIFLGYPLCDVIGFIQHKPCKFCGYWKVYENVTATKQLFSTYDTCTKQAIYHIDCGKCIEQFIQ